MIFSRVTTGHAHCRTCGSTHVRKTYVEERTDGRWGFVIRECADCERRLGDYEIKREPPR